MVWLATDDLRKGAMGLHLRVNMLLSCSEEWFRILLRAWWYFFLGLRHLSTPYVFCCMARKSLGLVKTTVFLYDI